MEMGTHIVLVVTVSLSLLLLPVQGFTGTVKCFKSHDCTEPIPPLINSTILDCCLGEDNHSFKLFNAFGDRKCIECEKITDKFGTAGIELVDPKDPSDGKVTDTVVGDPLFTVAVYFSGSVSDLKEKLGKKKLELPVRLCYEVHGKAGATFNLISSKYTSVTAKYYDDFGRNVIRKIGILAQTDDGCVSVAVDGTKCGIQDITDVIVYGAPGDCPVIVDMKLMEPEQIRFLECPSFKVWSTSYTALVSVPNGDPTNPLNRLIMQIDCQPDNSLRFAVLRSFRSESDEKIHGLLGQFWNQPLQIDIFKGKVNIKSPGDYPKCKISIDDDHDPDYSTKHEDGNRYEHRNKHKDRDHDHESRSYPDNRDGRSFVGWLVHRTWEKMQYHCLYVGNRQAGKISEVDDPTANDNVISGDYRYYKVNNIFDVYFKFNKFKFETCATQAMGSSPH